MRPGRRPLLTGALREELWRRYKAGETILGIGRALGQPPRRFIESCNPQAVLGLYNDADLPECSALRSAKKSRAAFLPVTRFALLPETCGARFLQ